MTAFIPLIVWVLSAVFCDYVARARNVKKTFARRAFVVLFGPIAIPFVFLLKPEPS